MTPTESLIQRSFENWFLNEVDADPNFLKKKPCGDYCQTFTRLHYAGWKECAEAMLKQAKEKL